jgi:hypothetical protein
MMKESGCVRRAKKSQRIHRGEERLEVGGERRGWGRKGGGRGIFNRACTRRHCTMKLVQKYHQQKKRKEHNV